MAPAWESWRPLRRLRAGFCWCWWQRNLHGSRRASTSDHVRRSSITTPRSHAVFTNASVSGQVFYLPGVALGALPAATPRIFSVIRPFVARCLGGARCWHRRGSLGGPCDAFGRVGANGAPGPFCDRSAARPRRDGLSGFQLANRHRRLLLGRHDDEEASN